MSVRRFFTFTTGLLEPLRVPVGTLQGIREHVEHIERTLGLEAMQYGSNPPHWRNARNPPGAERLTDERLCEIVGAHNNWVHDLYEKFAKWQANPVDGGEEITPEDAQTFWHALEELDVPVSRWSSAYYVDQMEHLYEVLRGRENEGVYYDAEPLTEKQAGAVICLIEAYLDPGDHRLMVCRDQDCLTEGEDYGWCSKCAEAIHEDDIDWTLEECPQGRECPLRDYRPGLEDEEGDCDDQIP